MRALQAHSRERRKEGVFVVEGVRLAEEALSAGWVARLALYSDELNPRGQAVIEAYAARGAPVEQVAAHVLHAASDTETPQGILLVLAYQDLPLSEKPDFIFIPDGVRDPGNLGAMLRTAAAAGVQAVLCPPETADAFAPKVVRAGMGAHFRLPVLAMDWDQIAENLKGLRVFLAAAEGDKTYYQCDFHPPLALVVGGEAEGARPQARKLATETVSIPMPGGSESLNAAVAAGVLIFEVLRQRSEG